MSDAKKNNYSFKSKIMKIQKGIKLLVLLLFVSTIQLSAQAAWKIVSSNNAKVISGKSYYLQVAKNDFS